MSGRRPDALAVAAWTEAAGATFARPARPISYGTIDATTATTRTTARALRPAVTRGRLTRARIA
jgi:hypothetical protein